MGEGCSRDVDRISIGLRLGRVERETHFYFLRVLQLRNLYMQFGRVTSKYVKFASTSLNCYSLFNLA